MRYKEKINSFNSGLDLIKRFRPVSFNWIGGGALDLGLVAEEVDQLVPHLVTRDDKGQIEGVKYDRIAIVFINAIKEQQAQLDVQEKKIAAQDEAIRQLRSELRAMKRTLLRK